MSAGLQRDGAERVSTQGDARLSDLPGSALGLAGDTVLLCGETARGHRAMTFLQQLIRRWRERHVDTAWAPTGYRYSFRGYDSSKPSLAARRARECEVEQR